MQARRDRPKGKLVVVIDDDRTILQAMAGLLRSWGIPPFHCHRPTQKRCTASPTLVAGPI